MVPTDAVENSIHTVTGEAEDFLDEVRIAVVDGGSAKFPNYFRRLRRTRSEHFHAGEPPQLQQRSPDAARGAVNQNALSRLYLRRTIEHLVCGDIVQDDCDGFCRVQACGRGNKLALWQANIL